MWLPYNGVVAWMEDDSGGVRIFRPTKVPDGVTIAFSGRGRAPENESTPTAFLARRFAKAVGLAEAPIHWAKQVHGNAATTVREPGSAAESVNVGECDALATDRPGVALVVQTADCVPILLASSGAVGAAHAGWRGSAKGVARAAIAALQDLGTDPATLSAWIGPSIGPCCYEVGGEVAARFAGDFLRTGCGGGFRLDLRAVNVAQLEAAGVPREAISVFPECTKCGGERFASWRRDGTEAGRMIALVARSPQAGVRSA
jgi:purine-nucleoside/S-methyl-5'-thioadenosine phosphorylase / adenosine deaminase